MATGSHVQITKSTSNTDTSNDSVFITLDTSGSMAGSKITEVIASLNKIINDAPQSLRFVIRVFNNQVETIVSKKKKYLDLPRLNSKIQETVGNFTALYDAWIQTIDQIPYNCKKGHVVIFTDGEDTCSNSNLDEALKKTSLKMNCSKWHFTFVQAGNSSNCSKRVEAESVQNENFTFLSVEDSAAGIRFAFEKIQNKLNVHFNFSLNVAVGDLKKLSLGNQEALINEIKNSIGNSASEFRLTQARSTHPKNTIKTKNFRVKESHGNRELESAERKCSPINSSSCNTIWVGDIPFNESLHTIHTHFQKWGSCKVTSMQRNKNKHCQWAIVTYDTKEQAEAATLFATKFNGINLSVKQNRD